VGRDSGGGAAATDSQAPYVKYTAQLRSAAPIRQAIVRQQQIQSKYDKASTEDKQSFDENAQTFLAGPPSDFVVVFVSFEANNRDTIQDLLRHWQSQTLELLHNSVFLRGSKGDRVPLSQYVPVSGANQEFQFIFPRHFEGKEVLQPGDRGLQLEFDYPVIRGLGDGRGFFEFRIDKMKIDNEVIY
ncbi:MAG: hypothetical protein LBJ21_06565, partial [Acidobacteriota bacterium]|nr:hypothetical protein [Acidobacteriota bacterium]